MEKPNPKVLHDAVQKMLERMVEAGWISAVVAREGEAASALTPEGEVALRQLRRLLFTYRADEFAEIDLQALLTIIIGDELAFIDER